MAAVALAVESVAAAAVRARITRSLHVQHAAEDAALLHTARSLADGSTHLVPRTPSMALEAEVRCQHTAFSWARRMLLTGAAAAAAAGVWPVLVPASIRHDSVIRGAV